MTILHWLLHSALGIAVIAACVLLALWRVFTRRFNRVEPLSKSELAETLRIAERA